MKWFQNIDAHWKRHVTTKLVEFDRYERITKSGRFEFRIEGWLMLVDRQYVVQS